MYKRMDEVLNFFDLDCIAMGYDGSNVWGLPRTVRALQTGSRGIPGKPSANARRLLRHGGTPQRLLASFQSTFASCRLLSRAQVQLRRAGQAPALVHRAPHRQVPVPRSGGRGGGRASLCQEVASVRTAGRSRRAFPLTAHSSPAHSFPADRRRASPVVSTGRPWAFEALARSSSRSASTSRGATSPRRWTRRRRGASRRSTPGRAPSASSGPGPAGSCGGGMG